MENVSLQQKLERRIPHLERESTVPTEHEGEQEENLYFTILVSILGAILGIPIIIRNY